MWEERVEEETRGKRQRTTPEGGMQQVVEAMVRRSNKGWGGGRRFTGRGRNFNGGAEGR